MIYPKRSQDKCPFPKFFSLLTYMSEAVPPPLFLSLLFLLRTMFFEAVALLSYSVRKSLCGCHFIWHTLSFLNHNKTYQCQLGRLENLWGKASLKGLVRHHFIAYKVYFRITLNVDKELLVSDSIFNFTSEEFGMGNVHLFLCMSHWNDFYINQKLRDKQP